MHRSVGFLLLLCCVPLMAQSAGPVTYAPYLRPGPASGFSGQDSMVVAWQTAEETPHPQAWVVSYATLSGSERHAVIHGRVVDDYLPADPALPVPENASGPRVDYWAVLDGLQYRTEYRYTVHGPGLENFSATFRSRPWGTPFKFAVLGDEGYFPEDPAHPGTLVDYEARMVHEVYDNQPDMVVDTGDNVYNRGADDNYRDYWMPVWNSDQDDVDHGAPLARHIPVYVVLGNHDLGGAGDRSNLLADDTAGPYVGNLDGGDALAYFNNYYLPLNGPNGVDVQAVWKGDSATADGMFLHWKDHDYTSPAAIEAYRNSTSTGSARQIDHMSNFSFDYGNAHFVFLDANPHLFGGQASYDPTQARPPEAFSTYPKVLADWLVHDLDSSSQLWKFAVFHQPPFSSGNTTMRNFQMRSMVKLLEDHGVNVVFCGHSHNYQRSRPIRATERVADVPTPDGPPLVELDTTFDGAHHTVPDGVLYLIEGAGGDRDFDNDLSAPRGLGPDDDQDDSARGPMTDDQGKTWPTGPVTWLDDHLTSVLMKDFYPTAGQGPKITVRFKAKVFSFGSVEVGSDHVTLTQFSEPLGGRLPPAGSPAGTDVNGQPLAAPLPDTVLDAATGHLLSSAGTDGKPGILDRFTITRPPLPAAVRLHMKESEGSLIVQVENRSHLPLNAVQVDLQSGPVITLGRLGPGQVREVTVPAVPHQHARVRSSTTLPGPWQ